ncbi:MAG: GNAT family N-acetyltransferase [Beijerinckiaceae bacterium]|nr:GNAT family N-acetyltransferase [Beijerinckiaceae bacterium]
MSDTQAMIRPAGDAAANGGPGSRQKEAVARLLEWQEAEALSAEWEELSRNCLDPNPFFEPAFALSLAQHSPPERRPRFLVIRQTRPEQRLIGLFVLDRSGPVSWNSPFVALGSPLLRRGSTSAALDAANDWLRAHAPGSAGFFHTRMDARGPTCRAILSHALRNNLPMQEFDRRSRAAMQRDDKGVMQEVAGKRRKELGRLLRRLQDKGEVAFSTASSIGDVRNSMEVFLALEGGGWKGERGTALVCNPVLATFTRAATRRLAGLSKCRVETMSLNGEPIAMGVVLVSQDHAAFWKIAFDERYAAYSPGAQLTLAMARAFAQDQSISLVDSCAMPDHPMIDHLWSGRREIIDVLVGGGDLALFERAVQMEQARRSLRRIAKSAFLTLTGRHPS